MRLILGAVQILSLLCHTRGFSPRIGLKIASLPTRTTHVQSTSTEDCGCPVSPSIEYSGKISSKARTIINPKLTLADLEIFYLNGTPTTLNQVEFSNNKNLVHVISFMRSFG